MKTAFYMWFLPALIIGTAVFSVARWTDKAASGDGVVYVIGAAAAASVLLVNLWFRADAARMHRGEMSKHDPRR